MRTRLGSLVYLERRELGEPGSLKYLSSPGTLMSHAEMSGKRALHDERLKLYEHSVDIDIVVVYQYYR